MKILLIKFIQLGQISAVDFQKKNLVELKNYLYLLSKTKNQVWASDLFKIAKDKLSYVNALYNKHTNNTEGQNKNTSNILVNLNAHLLAGIFHLQKPDIQSIKRVILI